MGKPQNKTQFFFIKMRGKKTIKTSFSAYFALQPKKSFCCQRSEKGLQTG